jgi:glutaredoxin-like protein
MGLINGKDAGIIRDRLNGLPSPVTLAVFSDAAGCGYCEETVGLATEVSGLSENKVSVEIFDLAAKPPEAKKLGIDKVPAIAIKDAEGRVPRIRFFGIPAGYEFLSLMETIEMVARGDSGLAPLMRERLKDLASPIHLQVFVTPSCPYCPSAVLLAFRMAMESELITASMVQAPEFPALAARYEVSGVPHTVMGQGGTPMLGAVPEATGVAMVLAAARAQGGR